MPETKLKDVLSIKHGYAIQGSSMAQGTSIDRSTPVVTAIGDFDYSGGYGYRPTKSKHLIGEIPENYVLNPGQILLAMTCQTPGGEILGIPGKVPDDGRKYIHNQRIGLVEFFEGDLIDKSFFYHFMKTEEVRRQLLSTATGTKILHTSPNKIGEVEIPDFSIDEQKAIGAVLQSLDDKIEANTKLANTADELASALYLQATQTPTSLSTFDELAAIGGGGTPSTKNDDFWNGPINWATPTDITALSHPYLFETSRKITEQGLSNCASILYPKNTILMTSRATIGAFALAQVETAVNQGFITVQSNDPNLQLWLYYNMKSRVDEFKQWANGATFLELSRKNFKNLAVPVPELRIINQFNDSVQGLIDSSIAAVQENQKLIELRDYLLPRLMSGKITVKEAESFVK